MASVMLPVEPTPGFSFENCRRNEFLKAKGYKAPVATKTGTTIVGCVFADGVILGADTRATAGSIVADKECAKIHYMAKNMYCCGAGTAADTEATTALISSQLELHRLNTGRVVPVVTAATMLKQMLFRYQGHIGAALILGGVDSNGSHLYTIAPQGSTSKNPFTSMGSGSLAAMSILEKCWKPNMTEEEAKKVIRDAIAAGIFNDLGSGSNVDLCVIRKGSVEYVKPYEKPNVKGTRTGNYKFKRGTTEVLSKKVVPIIIEEEIVKPISSDSQMDTS
nr:PREDICTED: proteasome subunit beta type-7 [Bemisia tabaci]